MTSPSPGKATTLLICALIPIASSSQTSSQNVDEDRLITIEHLLNEADARHDAKEAMMYLDDTYRVKSDANKLDYDKPAVLQELRREAETRHNDVAPMIDGIKASVHGKRARVTFNYIVATGKETRRFHMVDTFAKRADGWKLIHRTGTRY